MKKYNLSKIMKRAWEIRRISSVSLSEGLKKSWAEAKRVLPIEITMNVCGKETFTVNTVTGLVYGKTYNSRDFLKDNFNAKWNPVSRQWTVDVEKFRADMVQCEAYYKKYIVDSLTPAAKEILSSELVNCYDGFYSYVTYTDGSHARIFVG